MVKVGLLILIWLLIKNRCHENGVLSEGIIHVESLQVGKRDLFYSVLLKTCDKRRICILALVVNLVFSKLMLSLFGRVGYFIYWQVLLNRSLSGWRRRDIYIVFAFSVTWESSRLLILYDCIWHHNILLLLIYCVSLSSRWWRLFYPLLILLHL